MVNRPNRNLDGVIKSCSSSRSFRYNEEFRAIKMVEYPPPVLSPKEFELQVKQRLDLDANSAGLVDYQSRHREIIGGADGEYEIDITLRFSAFGADYLTLVECKHYKRRVEREHVLALWAKMQP